MKGWIIPTDGWNETLQEVWYEANQADKGMRFIFYGWRIPARVILARRKEKNKK